MKKTLISLFISLLTVAVCDTYAQLGTQTPSEQYYQENIAASNALAQLPSTRAGDDDLDPGGSSGGEGGWVGAPISDTVMPLLMAIGLYAAILTIRKERRQASKA